jgi:hypothetical protein
MRVSSVEAAMHGEGPGEEEGAGGAGGGPGTDEPITFIVRVAIGEERDVTPVVERGRT